MVVYWFNIYTQNDAAVEKEPALEGRIISLLLAPKKIDIKPQEKVR